MKTDIEPLLEADNIGGSNALKFAYVDDVESIPDAVMQTVDMAIVMKAGKRFYDLPFTLETLGFTDTQADSENGALYDKSVNGFCPCDVTMNAGVFNYMENSRFILVIDDNNGLRRIVGTVAEPLQFKADRVSPPTTVETPGYNFSFYGQGTQQAYIYDVDSD